MRLDEFTQLTNEEKAALLYEQGVYIGKRRVGDTPVLLYQIEGFYAEVWYRRYRRVIGRISCFATTTRLEPYLADINVEHLV